jgi:D-alanyl-lipoteichoic acid acyltransferase DltB (MBOAT superfamily)
MCIADSLNSVINEIWGNLENSTGSTLTIAALLYAIQMYTDFDGYSNMAIGVGKLLGINVTRNFNHPLLARNTAEYWRRWHMSLTTWITDYVYMPLNIAFRNFNQFGIIIAVIINLVIIGLWHGANWTFGLFGLYHGLLFIPLVFSGAFGKNKKLRPSGKGLPQIKDILKMIGTFILVSIGLIIFKADNIQSSISYFSHICSPTLLSIPSIDISKFTLLLIVILFVTEWYQRDKEYPLQWNPSHLNNRRWLILVVDYAIIASILFKGDTSGTQFIYFQF